MNKNILIFAFFSFILFAVIITGCVKDVGKLPAAAATGCDTVTYTKHIKPIIDASCISCHGNPLSGGATVFLTNYAQVKAAGDNGTFKSTVFDAKPDLMPYGGSPLPQAQKDLISCWLSNGEKQ